MLSRFYCFIQMGNAQALQRVTSTQAGRCSRWRQWPAEQLVAEAPSRTMWAVAERQQVMRVIQLLAATMAAWLPQQLVEAVQRSSS